MHYLIVHTISNRLSYTAQLLLKDLLGMDFAFILLKDYKSEDHPMAINYSGEPIPETFFIPNAGLLKSEHIQAIDLKNDQSDIPHLFNFPPSDLPHRLDYDIFSAVFFLVSEYEKYLALHTDQYERYEQDHYSTAELPLKDFPLVHTYAEELRVALVKYMGKKASRKWSPPLYDYEITWDIDAPWKYLKKGMHLMAGGLGRDIVKGNWTSARERTRTILTQKDPYHTFSRIFKLCPPEQTRFFFLIDRNSPQDTRFTWSHPHFRTLMQGIHERAYGVGIHPSFTSFLDRDRIVAETKELSGLLKTKITHSRQHFLKYRLPATFRYLWEAGIRHEYTPCLFKTGGFPNGMARPYPWFDLMRNTATDLILHPTIVMDRTLQKYLKLDPIQAKERFLSLLEKTREANGVFTLLLHNDALSESDEWKGWRNTVETWIGELVADGW